MTDMMGLDGGHVVQNFWRAAASDVGWLGCSLAFVRSFGCLSNNYELQFQGLFLVLGSPNELHSCNNYGWITHPLNPTLIHVRDAPLTSILDVSDFETLPRHLRAE